jgi:hypothetical protein
VLLRTKEESVPTRLEYRSYISGYCEYYIAGLYGSQGMTIKSLERALRMTAPPIIHRWLPLS